MDTLKESRRKAWVHIAINQLAFPGLGTLMAGRRVGWIQAVVMVVGFVLTMAFMILVMISVIGYWNGDIATEEEFYRQFQPYAWAGVLGVVLCAVAWFWSLWSGVSLLSACTSSPPELPHHDGKEKTQGVR